MIPSSEGLGTESVERFKQKLYETRWNDLEVSQNPDQAFKTFSNKFSNLYNASFPKKQIKLKIKDAQSPLIMSGIKKSFKQKQCFYEKFLKN